MITLAGVKNRRIAVLGLGRTGLAACRSLTRSGAEALAWDDAAEVRDAAAESGIEICDLNDPSVWNTVDSLIVSPGIPHLYPAPNPIVAAASRAGIPLDNDIGLFLRTVRDSETAPAVIAVTGSNGKSTTAALIDSVLKSAGRMSRVAGNIGNAVLGLEMAGKGGFVILEVSSYQAELARCLDADIAVFLNFSSDHLDRHGGLGGYFAAKRRLFSGRNTVVSVIGVDESEGRLLASQAGPCRVVRISAAEALSQFSDAVFVRDGRLVERAGGSETGICDLDRVQSLTGRHNRQNACAAYAACRSAGLSALEIAAGFKEFPGLPHRSQIVGEFDRILCVNDSKATNAESAGRALDAYRNIRWIVGGLGKEGGIISLSERFENVVKAYLIGHSAKDFALQLGTVPYAICGSIPDAVAAAAADAVPGDTILLAPAAASFDQYPDFEARGDHFVSEVKRRLGNG